MVQDTPLYHHSLFKLLILTYTIEIWVVYPYQMELRILLSFVPITIVDSDIILGIDWLSKNHANASEG